MFKKNIIKISSIIGLFSLPKIALAQDIQNILNEVNSFFQNVAPVLLGVLVLLFLWGLTKYVLQTDSVEGKESAKNIMIWGLVTIFIIVTMWGLVGILIDLFGADPVVPTWPQIAT